MKLKKVLAAMSLAIAASGALASSPDIYFAPVSVPSGTDIDNLTVGSFSVTGTSNIDGYLYYIPSYVVPNTPITVNFSTATFAAASLWSNGVEKYHVETGSIFSFANVVAGTYQLQIDGDAGAESNLGSLIGAKLTVTPVPEPDSYAMLLAGLGLVGVVARRRQRA